jgi:hypothetical protein
MFKNMHLVIAMLVAPVLAVIAWFAVDYFVAERPHAAQEGAAYTLIAKSNCRYDSGRCDLENSDFSLSLRPMSVTSETVQLELTSAFPLQSAALGLVDNGAELLPTPMNSTADALRWTTHIERPTSADATLRLAVTAQGATWFAEVPVIFLQLADRP